MQSTTNQLSSLKEFAAYLQQQDRAPKTIQGYISDLGSFARWFHQSNGEKLTDKNLTPTDVREYRQWLVGRDSAPSTINRHLATLRVFAEWSGTAITVKGVEEQSLAPRWLDRKEQAALIRETEKAINAAQTQAAKIQGLRDRAVVILLLNCGLRISELCDLSTQDVELSDRKGKLIIRQGKGSKRLSPALPKGHHRDNVAYGASVGRGKHAPSHRPDVLLGERQKRTLLQPCKEPTNGLRSGR